ncbi:MAG: patatin-like phospholipase family protein [Nitrospirae bacterium]|jgi:NTE family protein|nr:patatin-like phospholipase family protein [Nitrospirota bacterium]
MSLLLDIKNIEILHFTKKILFLTFLVLVFYSFSCAPVETKPPVKPAKIAVVLGAGASKGFAHIGVLKVLETNKIPIHMIVGTSAGSFVGSLYAYGFNAFELQKFSFELQKDDLIDLGIPDNGFIKGEKLEKYINFMLRNTPMEKLRIPFYAVATDVQTGNEIIFGTGNTGTAVRASCSIPGVFMPPVISGRMYVDGGVVSPVAVDAARKMGADVVIAVDISGDTSSSIPKGTIETIMHSINIMYSKLSSIQLAKADVVIKPKVGYIGSADFSKRHEAVLEGEKAAISALPEIQKIVNRLKEEGRL